MLKKLSMSCVLTLACIMDCISLNLLDTQLCICNHACLHTNGHFTE